MNDVACTKNQPSKFFHFSKRAESSNGRAMHYNNKTGFLFIGLIIQAAAAEKFQLEEMVLRNLPPCFACLQNRLHFRKPTSEPRFSVI